MTINTVNALQFAGASQKGAIRSSVYLSLALDGDTRDLVKKTFDEGRENIKSPFGARGDDWDTIKIEATTSTTDEDVEELNEEWWDASPVKIHVGDSTFPVKTQVEIEAVRTVLSDADLPAEVKDHVGKALDLIA